MPYTRWQEQIIAKLTTLKKTVIGESGHVSYDGFGYYAITNVPADQKTNLMLLLTKIVQDGQSKEVSGFTTPIKGARAWHKPLGFTTSVFVRGRAIDSDKLNVEVAKIDHPLVARPDIGCESRGV